MHRQDTALVPWSFNCRRHHSSLTPFAMAQAYTSARIHLLPTEGLSVSAAPVSTASLDTTFSGCCCRLMNDAPFQTIATPVVIAQPCMQLSPSCCYAACIDDTLQWFTVVRSSARSLACASCCQDRQSKSLRPKGPVPLTHHSLQHLTSSRLGLGCDCRLCTRSACSVALLVCHNGDGNTMSSLHALPYSALLLPLLIGWQPIIKWSPEYQLFPPSTCMHTTSPSRQTWQCNELALTSVPAHLPNALVNTNKTQHYPKR